MGFLLESTKLEWLSIAIVVITAVYYYVMSQFKFWERKGVKFIQPIVPFGNIKDMVLFRKSVAEVFSELYNYYPEEPFVGIYDIKPSLMIRDPELIKHVLVKDFSHFQDRAGQLSEEIDPLSAHLVNLTGTKWHVLRHKLTPTFTSGKMKMMFHFMVECADQLKEYLVEPAKTGEMLEMKEVMAKFTTDIIGNCAFGIQCNSMKDGDSEFRKMGRKVFDTNFTNTARRFMFRVFGGSVMKNFGIKSRSTDVIDFFTGTVKEMIDYREKNNVVRNDFMQLLIQLKNKGSIQDDKNEDNENQTTGISKNDDIEFTDNLLASQAFIFFLAGFETSSTTLSWCLYELSFNENIQTKLREEIISTLEKHDGKITYDGIQNMSYLDKVVNETLRKHSPVPLTPRRVTKPYVIPGTSVQLDLKQNVIIPIYAIHRDPKYYPDPERFDPERFSEEAKSTRPHYTFLPFGDGPRNCIGLRFGLLQTKVGLAILLSNFTFSVCDKTETSSKLDPKQIITSFRNGVWLRINKYES